MTFHRPAICLLFACTIGFSSAAWSQDATAAALRLELNAVQDTGNACRLTFVAQNDTGQDIEKAVFETVIFDSAGSVMLLSLFDFRDLPSDKPRVRQFDVPGTSCDTIGQALINGANTCTVAGDDSDLCGSALAVSSRIAVELLG